MAATPTVAPFNLPLGLKHVAFLVPVVAKPFSHNWLFGLRSSCEVIHYSI
ncbi:MAG: hypothetical protein JRM88_05110 [Nitrososphaerota archaeon]|nr:hypothetical protein [Nitrososphaerota archaeon]